jgi:hypothetical protein
MTKIKLSTALEIKTVLKEFQGKQLPSKLSYWLGRLQDKVDPIVTRLENERNKLITEKYGSKVEGTETYQVKPENMEDFSKELLELGNEEEDLDIRIDLELFQGVSATKEFFSALGEIVYTKE